ncbi:hypothetical protein [Erythrobacter sp.]|jgi:hypothetical protein|uniref:hypothetical protein n=1 Tax=Erythrobacter sp. TaxID=1042 RepID=UPI002EA1CCF5|nr:hypothetical protein [Erythrobacter sp.]
MPRYYLYAASLDHSMDAQERSICFLGTSEDVAADADDGDGVVIYTPTTEYKRGESVQKFTAIGRITGDDIVSDPIDSGRLYARCVDYRVSARDADVRPLLEKLEFVGDADNWGVYFRNPKREIPEADWCRIAEAMGLSPRAC